MTVLVWLIPIALVMGLVALRTFMWSIESGQYDDLEGAAERVLLHPQEDRPLPDEKRYRSREEGNNVEGNGYEK
ncbi:MAG: cbb3-type cytochrome oxidase assembly protein CcoS [Alphaproteobacteria bacterium HGW-Alphaproteobacteria-5]|nr:MAG: cbb3-type cytochrome oxidase assembly protein CcoS [Alphaproteobacteria bacterium HGW-Alphaproteobacteria-5]